ncbi:MAG: hypothetical protein OEL53_17760 [Rhodospirillales bacterium]|nr:hypothetical protein [Rhodospirillales bacterium]
MYGNLAPVVETVSEIRRRKPVAKPARDRRHLGDGFAQEVMVLGNQHHLPLAGQTFHQASDLAFLGIQRLRQIAHPGWAETFGFQHRLGLFPQSLVRCRQLRLMAWQVDPGARGLNQSVG